LLGPNGAGKTTTLLTLAGAIPQLGGEVVFLGATTRAPMHRRARKGLGFITEERSVFMGMSTADNLRVAGVDQSDALALFPELRPRLRVRAGLLSGGEQQMLTLARALARKPKLLLADELSLGLAPLIVQRLLEAVRSAADQGVGVLLVEQHVREVMKFADRVYVMRRGRVVLSGTADEVRGRIDEIEQSYMAADERSAG
jgi:ABC-type branched-subunit amino acid transport system ATPase component